MSSKPQDDEVLAAQIGRPLRAASVVRRRCALNLPVVAEVPPVLDTGEPFPTRYWLTCPLAHRRVARIEAAGGVRAIQQRVSQDPAFQRALQGVHERYASERDALVPRDAAHKPSGGVGGSQGGVKCLHAHYADHLAGNDNPVGRELCDRVEPLTCVVPCVIDEGGALHRNPNWREAAHGADDES